MSLDDVEYYRSRAAHERQAASQAANRYVAEIHEELARQYEALVENEKLHPPPYLKAPFRRVPGVRYSPQA